MLSAGQLNRLRCSYLVVVNDVALEFLIVALIAIPIFDNIVDAVVLEVGMFR